MLAATKKYTIQLLLSFLFLLQGISSSAQEPCNFLVDLGEDFNIVEGDTFKLPIAISIPITQIASITWTPPEGLSCTNCLVPTYTALEDICYTASVTDTSGCTVSDTICIFVVSTSIKELDRSANVELYPNPIENDVHIESLEYAMSKIEIFDALGRRVMYLKQPARHRQILNLSDLNTGIYYLRVELGHYFAVKRLIRL